MLLSVFKSCQYFRTKIHIRFYILESLYLIIKYFASWYPHFSVSSIQYIYVINL